MMSRTAQSPTCSEPARSFGRRAFFRALAGGSLTAAALARQGGRDDVTMPNVLVIVADDLGFADLGCYGSEIHTPHLDRLARGGVRFAQAYSFARCCPSRASLLTGRSPHQAGLGFMVSHDSPALDNPPGYRGFIRPEVPVVAEWLKAAGYQTGLSGKWHVGEHRPHWPCDRGFDESWGLLGGACSYFDPLGNRSQSVRRRIFHNDRLVPVPSRPDFYFTDEVAAHAGQTLRAHAATGRPFFHYVGFTAPHWPLHARASDIEVYRDRYEHGWDEVRRARHRRQMASGLVTEDWGLAPREDSVAAWADLPNRAEMAHKMAVYAAQVHRLDDRIGTLLATLDATGQRDRTLVIFVSDNGGDSSLPPVVDPGILRYDPETLGGPSSYTAYGPGWAQVSNTPFRRYKKYTHEGGLATPLIVSGPGYPAEPGWRRDPVTLADLVPSILESAGVVAPGLAGRSLGRRKNEAEVFEQGWEHMGHRAFRVGDEKIVAEHGAPWSLFDLRADRCELRDLARERPERVEALANRYAEWADRTGVLPWPPPLNGRFG
jgi:arylsulfatase A-like enzyme